MRVRIIKDPRDEDRWLVEVKHWWTRWAFAESFYGEDAQDRALKVAKALLNPLIIEVKA